MKKQRWETDHFTDEYGQLAVVLTTPTRDVWYGFLVGPGHDAFVDALKNRWAMLAEARHCARFDVQEGLSQLINKGPGPRAQIGAPSPLVGVPAIATLDIVPIDAALAFAKAGWSR
jgi:hypothetical protein